MTTAAIPVTTMDVSQCFIDFLLRVIVLLVVSILFLSDIWAVDCCLPSFPLPGFSTFSFAVLSGSVCCRHSGDGLVELCPVFDLRPCPEVPVIEEHWLLAQTGGLAGPIGPPFTLVQLLCHRLFFLLYPCLSGGLGCL